MAEQTLFSIAARNFNAAQFKNQLTVFTFDIPANDAGWIALRATITNFDPTDSLRLWFEQSIDNEASWFGVWGDGSPVSGTASGVYPSDETPAEWEMGLGPYPAARRGRLNCLMVGSMRAAVEVVVNHQPV